jgi:formylglycine-generating enzyme required for sulfatase activity
MPASTQPEQFAQYRILKKLGAACGVAALLGGIGLLGTAVAVALVFWVGRTDPQAVKDAVKEINKDGPPVAQDAKPGPVAKVGLIEETKFTRVPKGTFWMGGGSVEGPPTKQVTVANDIELAAYTVTQGQWEAVMQVGSNPSQFSRQGEASGSVADASDAELKRFPVENVSWNDVQKFLEKLNKREQGKGWKYRLPKEAEWEHGCRGAATTKEECSFDFYFAKGTNDLSWNRRISMVVFQRGTEQVESSKAERSRWVSISRTTWGCMICTATCGSGAKIYTIVRARTG